LSEQKRPDQMPHANDAINLEVSAELVKLSNGLVTLFFDTQLGLLMLTVSQEKTMCFSRAYVRVSTDAEVFDTRQMVYKGISAIDFKDSRGQGKAVVLRLASPDSRAEIHLKLSMVSGLSGYMCVVQFKNRSGQEMRIESIETFAIDVDDGTRLFTGWDDSNLRFFRNGFQSWDLSQASRVEPGENVSHFFTVLQDYKTGAGLVIGYLTMVDQFSRITITGRDDATQRLASVSASCATDGVPLADKKTIMSEEMLLVAPDDLLAGLRNYVEIAAERMSAVPWPSTPTGWCSWYFYYTQPDEDEIAANVRFLSQRYPNLEWVQLDDGYQKTVGDWIVNDRFHSGLGSLTKEIRAAGFKPGIWTAPFVATEHSDIFKDRPDLFVRDRNNQPVQVGQNPLWLGNYYALDLTNPVVLESIDVLFKTLKADGFEYFKIDFLFHAAATGMRHDPAATGAQAVRRGLETIRNAVGDDLLLGCGAPLGSCIGITNMMRIGNDIAAAWRYGGGIGVYECSINTMTRAILHNKWWVNDPDCVLVRQNDSELTLDEVRLWLSIVAVSGGAVLMSDRMLDVHEDRLAMLDKILPPFGSGGWSPDVLVEPEPRIFVLPVEASIGHWAVLAIVNLSETSIDVRVPLKEIGLEQKPHHLQEFWTQEYVGLTRNTIEVKGLKPHSSRLFAVRPENRLPCVLGTSIHFTQGAVELSGLDWDPASKELSVVVEVDTIADESVSFVFNDGWEPVEASIDNEAIQFEQRDPHVATVKSKFAKGQEIRVRFSKD